MDVLNVKFFYYLMLWDFFGNLWNYVDWCCLIVSVYIYWSFVINVCSMKFWFMELGCDSYFEKVCRNNVDKGGKCMVN